MDGLDTDIVFPHRHKNTEVSFGVCEVKKDPMPAEPACIASGAARVDIRQMFTAYIVANYQAASIFDGKPNGIKNVDKTKLNEIAEKTLYSLMTYQGRANFYIEQFK